MSKESDHIHIIALAKALNVPIFSGIHGQRRGWNSEQSRLS